jgi:hypothetical protein
MMIMKQLEIVANEAGLSIITDALNNKLDLKKDKVVTSTRSRLLGSSKTKTAKTTTGLQRVST